MKKFNEANGIGIAQIDTLVNQLHYDVYDLNNYFKDCISYSLTVEKRKGLELFLKKIKQPTYIF